MATPCIVSCVSPDIDRATPKSASSARPSSVMKMFSGFTSRWTIPIACAADSADATSRRTRTTNSGASGRSSWITCLSVRPLTCVITSAMPERAEVEHPVHADDVGMRQRGDETRFAREARHRLLVLEVLGANQLDGDFRPARTLAREIDDRGAAATDLTEDPVFGVERGESRRNRLAAHRRMPDV